MLAVCLPQSSAEIVVVRTVTLFKPEVTFTAGGGGGQDRAQIIFSVVGGKQGLIKCLEGTTASVFPSAGGAGISWCLGGRLRGNLCPFFSFGYLFSFGGGLRVFLHGLSVWEGEAVSVLPRAGRD